MRIRLVLLVVAVTAISTVAGASATARERGVHGYGLSLTLAPGWVGHALPDEISATTSSGSSKLFSAVVRLDQAVVSPQRYVPLPQRVHSGTTRLFVAAGGRRFFLYVHTTPADLPATNRVLASIRVEPWSASLAPPRFEPAPGWQMGRSGPAPAAHASVSAWASTVAYADGPVDLPPVATLARAGRRGVVVWVGLTAPRHRHPFPVRKDPLDLGNAFCSFAWEGAIPGVMQCTLWSQVPGRFQVSVYVYLRDRNRLGAAQAELRRLVLPSWTIR